jgi:hypothetical protein
LDGNIFYPKSLAVCCDRVVAIGKIIVVVNIADHKDGGKVFTTPKDPNVVFHHARP